MSKTQSAIRASISRLWPWVVGAFLVGIPVSILMPPLSLMLIIVLSAWGVMRRGHQTASSTTALAVDLGLGIVTAAYLVIWTAGNIAR